MELDQLAVQQQFLTASLEQLHIIIYIQVVQLVGLIIVIPLGQPVLPLHQMEIVDLV